MRHGSQKLGYVLLVSLATLVGVLGIGYAQQAAEADGRLQRPQLIGKALGRSVVALQRR